MTATTASESHFDIPPGGDRPPEPIRRDRYGRWLAYFPSRGWYPAVPVPTLKRWDKTELDWRLDARIWWATDTVRESWKNRAEEDPRLFRALTTDGTLTFLRTIQQLAFRFEGHEGGNAVIAIRGPRRSGKSFLAFSITGLWTRMMRSQAHITFSAGLTSTLAKSSDGDIIVVDENSALSGGESSTFYKQRKNLIDQTGVKKIALVLIGPDIDFKAFGRALDLGIEWWGAWQSKNATRFVVFDHAERPLYVAGLQRTFLWTQEPFASYLVQKHAMLDELIEAGGVDTAATAYDEMWDEYYSVLMQEIRERYPHHVPSVRTIRSIAVRDLKLRFPTISFRDDLCTLVRDDLKASMEVQSDNNSSLPVVSTTTSEGWETFREGMYRLGFEYGGGKKHRERDAWALAWWYVPETTEHWTYKEVARKVNFDGNPDSLGKQINRLFGRIPTKAVGDLGEICLASWLDSLRPRRAPSTGRGTPDLLVDVEGQEVAINVKTSLEDNYREHIPTTPEYHWRPNALIALVLPRLLEIRLFPITQPKQSINRNNGVLTTPERVSNHVREMVLRQQTEGGGGGV